jgi:hypothetical protein
MAGYSAAPINLAWSRQALFQIVGQAFQHQPQIAALLARANDGGVDGGEFARMLRQRLGKRRSAIDLGAQRGHQIALGLNLGLLGQRGQGALQWQAGRHQAGELPGPDRQPAGAEHARGKPA